MKQAAKVPRAGKKFVIITAAVAGLLLIIANSGLWVNRHIFDEKTFSTLTVQALTSDSSRNAIATAVSSNIYQDRPLVGKVLAEPTTNIIDGLLGTKQAEKALTLAASKLNIILTSKEQEKLTLDLSGVKSVLTRLAGVTNDRSAERLNPESIPESITILDSSKLPNLYGYATATQFISPIALIAAVGLLAWPLVKFKDDWRNIVRWQGVVIVAAGVFAELIGPIFRPITLSVATEPAQRTVLANLYDTFIATFNSQTLWILLLGLIMVVTPWLYDGFLKLARHRQK